MLRVIVALFAILLALSNAASAEDTERNQVMTAAAYLTVCPSLTPGPEFAAATARVVNKFRDSSSELHREHVNKMSALASRTLNDICSEALRLYGKNGTAASSWLIPKGLVTMDFDEIIAAGDNSFPNSTDRQVTSNYVNVSQANRCNGFELTAEVHVYLAKYGISVYDFDEGRRLRFVYASEMLRFLEWFDRNPSSIEGKVSDEAWNAFCFAQIAKFGPDGTIHRNVLIRK